MHKGIHSAVLLATGAVLGVVGIAAYVLVTDELDAIRFEKDKVRA